MVPVCGGDNILVMMGVHDGINGDGISGDDT